MNLRDITISTSIGRFVPATMRTFSFPCPSEAATLNGDPPIRSVKIIIPSQSFNSSIAFAISSVTDHRINLTLYNLSAVMDGDIQEIIDKLQVAENAERLRASEE